jgi:quinol-cytochrome oxidoreductase complex cytochrome b subunit
MSFLLIELLLKKKFNFILKKTNLIFFISSWSIFSFLFFFKKGIIKIENLKKNQFFFYFFILRGTHFRPIYKFFFWLFVLINCFLGWLGAQVVETPYVQLSMIITLFYFIYLLIILPLIEIIEKSIFIQK